MAATLGFVLGVEAEMHKGIVGERGGHEDVAAVTSIATRGTSARNELLTTEGHTAVTSVASLDADSCFIDKHCSIKCTGRVG